MSRPEGFDVPLHRSLIEPMLLAGIPRTVALVLWTSIGAVAFGLHQIWVVPIGLALHAAAAATTKSDPHFFDIVIKAIHTQTRLDP
jgi:type IV secretion system protein VirB3